MTERGYTPPYYCGGGMSDIGSTHAPHKAVGTDEWCVGDPTLVPRVTLIIDEKEAAERIAGVLRDREAWLPQNPYGVAALILDALGWPRLDGSIPWSRTRPAVYVIEELS